MVAPDRLTVGDLEAMAMMGRRVGFFESVLREHSGVRLRHESLGGHLKLAVDGDAGSHCLGICVIAVPMPLLSRNPDTVVEPDFADFRTEHIPHARGAATRSADGG